MEEVDINTVSMEEAGTFISSMGDAVELHQRHPEIADPVDDYESMALLISTLKNCEGKPVKDEIGLKLMEAQLIKLYEQREGTMDQKLLSKLLSSIATYGFVPAVAEGNDKELDETDFPNIAEKVMIVCRSLKFLLSHVQGSYLKAALVELVVFCGQHIEKSLWSRGSSVKQTKEILELVLFKHNCTSLQNLLTVIDDPSLVKKIFMCFLPYLTRSNWKCSPGMRVSFMWCLTNISHPHVLEVFNEVLPPSLLLVDDFVIENRISGIHCIHHILNNVPKATLQWYGRADVIYNALKNLVYHRDPGIILALYPCLLKVLSTLEADLLKPNQIRKANRYDDIYQLLLTEMDNEQAISLRKAYCEHLHLFITIMGITSAKHLKMTLRVLLQYLETYDVPEESTRLNCLTALHTLISVAWPRIDAHLTEIVRGLVRLIYDMHLCQSGISYKDAVVKNCVKILKQLQRLKPADMDTTCKPLLNLVGEIPAFQVINEIWES